MKHITIAVIAALILCIACNQKQPAEIYERTSASSATDTIRVSDDIELIRISPTVYVHVSVAEMRSFGRVSSNGLVVIDGGQAFLFDTPVNDAMTETLVTFIADSLHAEISAVVPLHWHGDCLGGLGYLHGKGVRSYAHQMTIDILKENALPVSLLPMHGFNDSLVLKLNQTEIISYYLGGGHSLDNIVVWIPSEDIHFGGCLIKDMASKGLGNIADADVAAWPATIKNVSDKFPTVKTIVPGHGNSGGRELLEHTLMLLEEHEKGQE